MQCINSTLYKVKNPLNFAKTGFGNVYEIVIKSWHFCCVFHIFILQFSLTSTLTSNSLFKKKSS